MSRCGECKLGCNEKGILYCEENLGYEQCIDRLQDALYAADRPQGEWVEKIVDDVKITVCSSCDKEPTFTHFYGSCGNYSLSDFCPNCGADMREREGE